MNHSCSYSKSQPARPASGSTGRKLRFAGLLLTVLSLGSARPAWCQGGSSGSWQGADIGAPGVVGGESLSNGVLTIAGGGSGVYGAFSGYTAGDHGHFTYQTVTGDVEIVARVQSFSGGSKAEVGLMLRESTDPQANIACTVCQLPTSSNSNPNFIQACRRPGFAANPFIYDTWSGTAPPLSPPFWLKLTRIGANYTTARSSDGLHWCPIQDTAGAAFATTSAFQAGFFVSGGGSAATAVIDSISIGAPQREYTTSWVGNTFSNDTDRFVSGGISALWVGADGRCYTNTFYDEAGEAAKIYSTDGRVMRSFTDNNYFGNNNVSEGSVTGDGQYIYILGNRDSAHNRDRPYRTDLDGNNTQPISFTSTIGRIGGMAAGNGRIFLSDVDNNKIWIASATTLSETGSFAFARPGPMAMDSRGDLWIIQRATDYPNAGNFMPKYPAAVLCYHPDGTFAGKQISGLTNPSALCADPNQDRLLVCENGSDQDIRIYTGLNDPGPTLIGTFGTVGGLFAGGTLGLLNDPASGGYARLYGPNGIGLDAAGNIYVSCTGIGSHLRKFDPNGNLLWSVSGLPFTHCPDFDPATDGQDLYWQNAHFTLDYSKTTPGSEWSYTGLSWNPFGPDAQGRPDGGTVFRRFGPNNDRFMFVMPGKGGSVYIYRYSGELAIPCGRIDDQKLWIDQNGDGQETADEDSSMRAIAGPLSFDVDNGGDVYILQSYFYDWAAGKGIIRHLRFQGLNAHGVPLYSVAAGAYEDQPIPSAMAYPSRIRYDAANDTMYFLGYQVQIVNNPTPDTLPGQPALTAYSNWSQPSQAARFFTLLPTPYTDPNFFYFDDPAHNQSFPSGDGFQYFAMDAVGDKIFVGELWGPIHVYDSVRGNEVTRLLPGPEVSGIEGWTDIFGGIRAFQRSTGEYVVVREDAGYRVRNLMFRWTPRAIHTLQAPANLTADAGADRIRLKWDGPYGLVQKYAVWRGTASGQESLLADNLTQPQFDDTTVAFGVRYYYQVTAANALGTSGSSNEVATSANTAATFTRADTVTQGTWKGVYGSQGYTVVGDSASYPAGIQVTATGHSPFQPPNIYTWAASTNDPRALQKGSGTDRIAAMWNEGSTPPKLQVDLNLTDGIPHQVGIYCLDWDSPNLRQTQIDMYDHLGKLLDSETAAQFQNGKYLIWNLSGHVQIVFTPNQYGLGISGLFVDPVADTTAPVTTASLNPAANQNGWNNAATTVTLTAADNSGGSGVQKIIYSVNGGTPVTVNNSTTGISVTTEGVAAITYHAVDNAGNSEPPHTLNVQIDEMAPTTLAAPSGTAGSNGWYTGPVSVTLTANDTNGSLTTSGVAQTTYSVDGGVSTVYTGAFSVSGDGSHTVTFCSSDNAGNTELNRSINVKIDTTPPTTSPSLSGPVDSHGRYVGAVQVTLTASDATSGVAKTVYSLDNGSTWQTYTGPFSESPEASYTVLFYSVDRAGNTEATQSTGFTIDRSATVTLSNLTQTYDGSPKVPTATTDPTGLAVSFTYNGSTTPPVNAGSYAVAATIVDPTYHGSATGTLVIQKATAQVSLGNLSQTYDGSPRPVSVTTVPPNLSVSVTYNGSSSAPVNAGSYPVTATVTDPNYQGSVSDTLVINPASAALTLSNLSQTYDGSPKYATVSTTPAGVAYTVSYSQGGNSVAAPTNPGSYTVTAAIADPNFTGPSATGTLVISKATAQVTLSNLSQTYDGTVKTASVSTNPAGLSVAVTYNGSSTAPLNAGSYAVVATVNDPTYQGTASGTLVINGANQTISFPPIGDQIYGEPAFAISATASSGLPVSFRIVSGPATVSGNIITLTGVGTVTIQASQAGSSNLSPATVQQSFLSKYSWSGFLQPINADGSSVFKLGSTVPVKFQLTAASAGISNAVATLTYARLSNNVLGQVNEAVSTSAADTGNQFRYDAGSGQYIFNWSTKGLTTGTYQLQINLGDGVSRTVQIGLR